VLNDIAGQHVKAEHVRAALDGATSGPVSEGNTGGGTGMLLFGFKGGTGTSSRTIEIEGATYTVGVLVQGNFGSLHQLLVDGVPVGREMAATVDGARLWPGQPASRDGSIIVIIGTDAPLSERQLGRLCRRGMLGLGRVGSTAGHGSGDILLAFSNAADNRVPRWPTGPLLASTRLADEWIGPVFEATVDATAEAVLNAMIAAETMSGRDNITAHALPHDDLLAIMRKYGR